MLKYFLLSNQIQMQVFIVLVKTLKTKVFLSDRIWTVLNKETCCLWAWQLTAGETVLVHIPNRSSFIPHIPHLREKQQDNYNLIHLVTMVVLILHLKNNQRLRTRWRNTLTSFLLCSVMVLSACLPSGSCLCSTLSSFFSTCFTSSILSFCSCSACGVFLFFFSDLTSCCCFSGSGVTVCLVCCLLDGSGLTMCLWDEDLPSDWAEPRPCLLLFTTCSALRDISASRMGGVWSGTRNCCTRLLLSLFGYKAPK